MTRPSAMPSTTSAAGHVPSAVNWYREHGRVHAAPSKEMAMYEMVRRHGPYDVAEGREALLVAYHRGSAEALNRAAREAWQRLGSWGALSWRHPVAGATGRGTG